MLHAPHVAVRMQGAALRRAPDAPPPRAGSIWKPEAAQEEREAQSAAMYDAMFDSITAVMPMGSPVAVT